MVVALAVVAPLHGHEERIPAGCHDLQVRHPHILQVGLSRYLLHELPDMPQKHQLTSQGWEIATLVIKGCRVLQYILLTPQIGSELPHGPVVEPSAEGIDNVHLQQGLVVVSIGEIHTVVVTDVGLISIGCHVSYLKRRLFSQQ